MEKLILILQKYKKIWIFGLACVALAIIILVAILLSNAARVKNAFNADSDIYNRMQVKITKTIKDLSVDVNEKQDDTDMQT
ncbi:MAG: hypothetical protein IJW78_05965, partial [Clostridia bacterium]|nr:hypothetical protein [Clostridia bacterium]